MFGLRTPTKKKKPEDDKTKDKESESPHNSDQENKTENPKVISTSETRKKLNQYGNKTNYIRNPNFSAPQ